MSAVPSVLVQIDIKAATLGDTAGILQQRLPHVRCGWLDVLRDIYRCRRRRTPGGHKLLPVARVHMPGGGVPRPLFDLADIDAFIDKVAAATSAPVPPVGTSTVTAVTIRMPRCDLAGPWQMRRAEIAT